jgi:uncharacterized protein YecT (DUF1311 family)
MLSRAIHVTSLLLALTAGPVVGQDSPTFECRAARNAAERLICSNSYLARWDIALNDQYQRLMGEVAGKLDEQERLRSEQRGWLTQRNRCRDRRCVEKAYEERLIELRGQKLCGGYTARGECIRKSVSALPYTADGRLVLRTWAECRSGVNKRYDGTILFRDQGEAIQIQADCIEAAIFDPCEDAGGTWGMAQCVWANLEVAERRIRKVQSGLSDLRAPTSQTVEAFAASAERWDRVRQAYCFAQNAAHARALARADETLSSPGDAAREPETSPAPVELGQQSDFYSDDTAVSDELVFSAPGQDGDDGEPLGLCYRRVTEERAQRLEELVEALKASDDPLARARFLEYLRDDPLPRAAE